MKKLVVILIAIVAIYTGLWFVSATKAKEEVELKLKQYVQSYGGAYDLKYDSLSVSGYPCCYEIQIHKPVFTDHGNARQKGKGELALDGSLSVGTNLFGTKYWIDRKGELRLKGLTDLFLPGDKDFTFNGKHRVTMEVANGNPLKAIFAPFVTFPKEIFSRELSVQQWWNVVHEIDIKGTALTLVDVAHQSTPIASQDHLHLKLRHHKESGDLETITFIADVKGVQFNKSWSDQLKSYPAGLVSPSFIQGFDNLVLYSSIKKCDFDMDLEALVPENFGWETFLQKSFPEASIELKKMVVTSSLGHSDIAFKASIKHQGADEHMHFGLTATSIVDKAGNTMIAANFVNSLKNMANNPKMPAADYIKKLLTCCEQDLPNLLPRYDELGKITFDMNFTQDRLNIGTPEEMVSFNLHPYDFTTDLYSSKIDGGISIAKSGTTKGQFVLDLVNWEAMIRDLVGYYNRIEPLIRKAAGQDAVPFMPPQIKEETVVKILGVVQSISDTPDKKEQNLRTTIDIPNMQSVTIGKKPWIDALNRLQSLSVDLLPPAAPAPAPKERKM